GVSWDELSKDKIRKFTENYKVSYPVLHGTQSELIQVGQAYQWEGYLPTTYLIDRDGYLKEVFVGARSESFILQRVEALL
ncbi:MAG: TlpA disulfide reductase family protein, partial [Candidatus Neomarinimicrobiota bacterium]